MEPNAREGTGEMASGAVWKSVAKAAFGMHEEMIRSMVIKLVAVKLLGGLLGAAFFFATVAWGVGICGSPWAGEWDALWALMAGAAWLAQCTWMGASIASLCWLAASEVGKDVSNREKILLSTFGVTPKRWVPKRGTHSG